MTGYEQFISNPGTLKQGKICRLWELKVDGTISNLLDFCRDFLKQRGFNYTGYKKDENGAINAVFNNRFVWAGAIQEGDKVAIRLKQI